MGKTIREGRTVSCRVSDAERFDPWTASRDRVAAAAAAALIGVQVVLGQDIGAGIFLVLIALLLPPALFRSRTRRENAALRTRRLTSVLYRIEVDEDSLELEYDQSFFRSSFDNLLITRRNSDFYVIHHELGPLVYVPAIALTSEEQRILDRHLSTGSFIWDAKLSRSKPR